MKLTVYRVRIRDEGSLRRDHDELGLNGEGREVRLRMCCGRNAVDGDRVGPWIVVEVYPELPALPVHIADDRERRRHVYPGNPPDCGQLRWCDAAMQPADIVRANEPLPRLQRIHRH